VEEKSGVFVAKYTLSHCTTLGNLRQISNPHKQHNFYLDVLQEL